MTLLHISSWSEKLAHLRGRMELVPDRRVGYLLVGFLLVRLIAFSIWPGWGAAVGYAGDSDGPNYHIIAQQLAMYGRFANADGSLTLVRPPGFPFWVALLYRIFGPEATWAGYLGQQLLLSGVAVLSWLLARHLFGPAVGLLTAVLVSIDPVLTYLAWTYLTEPLHIFLLLMGLYLFYKGMAAADSHRALAWAGMSGTTWALAVLTRPYFQLLPFFLLPLAWPRGARARRMALVASLFIVLGMAPWLVRNSRVAGQWVPLTLNAGVTLWGGNNPYAQGDWVESSTHPGLYRDAPRSSDLARDTWFRQQAVTWIRKHPQRFVQLIFLKLYRLFHFYNFTVRNSLRWMFVLGGLFPYLVCLPFAFHTAFQRRLWSRIWPLFAVSIPTLLSAIIFYGDIRIRTPVEPIILLLASVSIWQLVRVNRATTFKRGA